MSEQSMFVVGPAQPVTDSRELPAVSPEDEAGFVHGTDTGEAHPDNRGPAPDAGAPADPPGMDADDEELPSEDELDEVVADVDADDVDAVGFDDDDLAEPLNVDSDRSVVGGS